VSDDKVCPTCKGKCCRDPDCRDPDYGYRVVHRGAKCYKHDCEDCNNGNVPQPDPRDATIAHLMSELAEKHAENVEWANASLVTNRKLANLREAIQHWAVGPHAQWCTTRADCPCDCGAAQEFEARETARKLVGLGDGEL